MKYIKLKHYFKSICIGLILGLSIVLGGCTTLSKGINSLSVEDGCIDASVSSSVYFAYILGSGLGMNLPSSTCINITPEVNKIKEG